MVYFEGDRSIAHERRLTRVPDLVVEVVSPESRAYDSVTKKSDYEAAGVREYWLIDPLARQETFFRHGAGRFGEVTPAVGGNESVAVTGSVLDLNALRRCYASPA